MADGVRQCKRPGWDSYTLMETAKLNGVDPQAWLADTSISGARVARELDVLVRIDGKPACIVSCPIPDVCIDERRLPLFIARATLRDLIVGLKARATGGAAR